MRMILFFLKKSMRKAKYIRNLLSMDGGNLLYEDEGLKKLEN